jgi:phage terminase small subunit
MDMADLRPKEMIFVTEYIRNGGNATQAAIVAGYSEKTAYSAASRLLKNVNIQQYLNKTEQNLNRDLRTMFVEEAKEAFETMRHLMKNSGQDNVRYSAAKDILDRAGYKPVEKVVADSITEIVVGMPDGMMPIADD